jgi:hypothetical protein
MTSAEKFKMKTMALCAGIIATLALSSGLANATDARQAIILCDKNPVQCKYNVKDNGSVTIQINGNQIDCPQEGQCVCTICAPPSRTGPGKLRNVGKVTNALTLTK